MYIRTNLVLLYEFFFYLHLRHVTSIFKKLSSENCTDVSNPCCIVICMLATTDEWKAKKSTQQIDSIRMFK